MSGDRNKTFKAKHCRALGQLRLFHASWNADESKFHYVIFVSDALRYSHVYFHLQYNAAVTIACSILYLFMFSIN